MANIRKRGKNSYQITVFCGRDCNGKSQMESITYHPDDGLTPRQEKLAVQDFAREFEKKVLNKDILDGRKISLQDFSDYWRTEWAPGRLQGRSITDYTLELTQKILPVLGNKKLTDIRPATINSFVNSLSKDGARNDGKAGGYKKSSIKKTFNVLSSVLHVAVDLMIIDHNPCENVRIHSDPPSDTVNFFTPEEACTFLDQIERPYYIHTQGHSRTDDTGNPYQVGDYESIHSMPEQLKILFNMAIYTGMRKAELLALTWDDLDFENNKVTITKAITLVNGKPVIDKPKTRSSCRVVSYPKFLSDRLHRLKVERMRYKIRLGDYWKGDQDWVFIQDNGNLMNLKTPNTAMTKALRRYNEEHPDHPLPTITFHGLRHTSATLLIADRQDIKTVQARLGHAEASTTLNIYAHALLDSDRKASDALASMLPNHG